MPRAPDTPATFVGGYSQYEERTFIEQIWGCSPEEAIPAAIRPAVSPNNGCLDKTWVTALLELASIQVELDLAQQLMLHHSQTSNAHESTLDTLKRLVGHVSNESEPSNGGVRKGPVPSTEC